MVIDHSWPRLRPIKSKARSELTLASTGTGFGGRNVVTPWLGWPYVYLGDLVTPADPWLHPGLDLGPYHIWNWPLRYRKWPWWQKCIDLPRDVLTPRYCCVTEVTLRECVNWKCPWLTWKWVWLRGWLNPWLGWPSGCVNHVVVSTSDCAIWPVALCMLQVSARTHAHVHEIGLRNKKTQTASADK